MNRGEFRRGARGDKCIQKITTKKTLDHSPCIVVVGNVLIEAVVLVGNGSEA